MILNDEESLPALGSGPLPVLVLPALEFTLFELVPEFLPLPESAVTL